jgi:Male sterility protein
LCRYQYYSSLRMSTHLPPLPRQGYAISKLVAEHSLLRIHHAAPTAFHLNIVRVGQICGDTVTGSWSQKEMMPMMIASLPALRAFPRSMPHVTWIPSDVCADAMRDIVVSPRAREGAPAWQIIHLANPHRGPWAEVARRMGEMAGVGVPELVPFRDYVALIKRHKGMLPVTPLLPYFVSSLEEGTMPERYASLEVSSSLECSASLAACPPIASELLAKIVRESLKGHKQAPAAAAPSPVFLFGPWSSLSSASADASKLIVVEKRIMAVAERIRSNLADTVDVPE